MNIVFEFVDGHKVIIKDVHGEVKDYYMMLAGIKENRKIPSNLYISIIEERSERRFHRHHKYTGHHVSYESIIQEGVHIRDTRDEIEQLEWNLDLEIVINKSNLTSEQHHCFFEVNLNGKTQRDVAKELGKSKTAVAQAISGAKKKLAKNFHRI